MFEWIKNTCSSISQSIPTPIKQDLAENALKYTITLIGLAALGPAAALYDGLALEMSQLVISATVFPTIGILAKVQHLTSVVLDAYNREIPPSYDDVIHGDAPDQILPPRYEEGGFPHEAPPAYGSWNHG